MSKATTPYFRVAYPSVFKPKRNNLSGKDEYSVVALFKKGENLDALKKAAQAAVIAKWGEDKAKWPSNLKSPFKQQGERIASAKREDKAVPQGYEQDAIYINLKSAQRPGVVGQDVQPIIDEAEFYGGCWALATVNAFAYDQSGNRGVSFGLMNLQKFKDDDHFGNRSKPEDDFKPVANPDAEAGGSESASDMFR